MALQECDMSNNAQCESIWRSQNGKQEPTSIVVMQRVLEVKWRNAKKADWVLL